MNRLRPYVAGLSRPRKMPCTATFRGVHAYGCVRRVGGPKLDLCAEAEQPFERGARAFDQSNHDLAVSRLRPVLDERDVAVADMLVNRSSRPQPLRHRRDRAARAPEGSAARLSFRCRRSLQSARPRRRDPEAELRTSSRGLSLRAARRVRTRRRCAGAR